MEVRQVVAGIGVVALGVCAALPFQRTGTVQTGSVDQRRTNATLSLQVRGDDAPAAAIDASLSPIEHSNAESSSPNSKAVEDSAFPASPNLTRIQALPELAESFEKAEPSSPVVNRRDDSMMAPAIPSPIPSPTRRTAAAAIPGGRDNTPLRTPSLSGVPENVRLGVPQFSELPTSSAIPPTRNIGNRGLAPAPLPEEPAREPRKHRIRDGDTLPELARRYLGNARRAYEIFEANRDVLSHPEILPLGRIIELPPR